jgi:hypothetical protein
MIRMDKVATASINNLRISEANFVSPSEQSITIPAAALQDLLGAIQRLKDEVEALREERDQDRQEIAALRSSVASLESLQESEISRLCVDIATDRRRLAKLEKVEPQPLQKDRGKILRALIAVSGGKMLAKEARQKMHLSKNRFSELLVTLKDEIEVKPLHSDKRKLVLKLVPRN